MFCTIYKISNNFDNKVYIGQTWRPMLERFKRHCKPSSCCKKLRNAIQKYGKENFNIKFLTCATTQETSDYWEKYFIKKYNSIKKGYNLTEGGEGFRGKHSEKSKKKMSKSLKGRKFSEEHRKNLSESGKRRKYSEETKKKLSELKKGKPSKKRKLTFEIAQQIREEYKLGNISQTKLGKKYKVPQQSIRLIINYKQYVI